MENKTENIKAILDIREIRRRSWGTAFRKGFTSWFRLMLVGFVFAFAGISNAAQASFVNLADAVLGLENEFLPNNTEIVKEFLTHFTLTQKLAGTDSKAVSSLVDGITRSQTWLVKLLGANMAYVQRNPWEVIAWLVIAAVMAFIIRNVIQTALVTGQYRYAMENRFAKEVRFSRVLAPFHKENIRNLVRVKFIYKFVLMLWNLTIIGGIYKGYQYRMVPLIIAENPDISWRDAKRLSKKMTDGCKFRIFLTEMSYFYLYLLEAVPVMGLLVTVPLMTQLEAEIYFCLRERITDEDRRFFIEKGFDRPAYIDEPSEAPEYRMKDHVLETPEEMIEETGYTVTDYIFMFFVFCFIGWVWEVSLHLIQHQEFVNRGTMYGPWLPIYGSGGVLMIFLLSRFKDNRPKMISLMVLLCGILEYLSSVWLDFIYNKSYWDYKEMFLNLNGRICLAGLVAFAIGGCFGIYVAGPRLRSFMHSLSRRKQVILCAVLVILFIADGICCRIFGFNTGSGVGESLSSLIGALPV